MTHLPVPHQVRPPPCRGLPFSLPVDLKRKEAFPKKGIAGPAVAALVDLFEISREPPAST